MTSSIRDLYQANWNWTEAIPGSVLEFYSSGATDLKATDIQQNIEKIYIYIYKVKQ